MVQVHIYRPAKTAMQSGSGKTDTWVLEFVALRRKFIEPIMGWTGSCETAPAQVSLRFPTFAAALNYANRQGWKVEIL